MKTVKQSININNEIGTYEQQLDSDVKNLFLLSQGRIRFGAGVDGERGENISGEWQTYTSNATPDTADSITHTLGSVPIGFIVVNLDKGAVIYDSGTAWTTTTISLKCNTASTTATIFILK
jgi:hypothetical protein